jgi:hypothetical protein
MTLWPPLARATRCASRCNANTRREISVAACSSATEISPRSQSSPIRQSAGAITRSYASAGLRSASCASRMVVSAPVKSADSNADRYASARCLTCSSRGSRGSCLGRSAISRLAPTLLRALSPCQSRAVASHGTSTSGATYRKSQTTFLLHHRRLAMAPEAGIKTPNAGAQMPGLGFIGLSGEAGRLSDRMRRLSAQATFRALAGLTRHFARKILHAIMPSRAWRPPRPA